MNSMKRPRIGSEQFNVEFKLGDANLQERTFRGRAMVFGAPVDTWPPTIVAKGAFSKTLKDNGSRVRILWQHDVHEPLGVPIEIGEDDGALRIHAKLDAIPQAERALVQIASGTLTDLSIGFDPIKWDMVKPNELQKYGATPEAVEKFSKEDQVRVIKEVRLWEVSVVTFGAQPAAKIGFTANTYRDLPVGDIEWEWDPDAARERVREWAGEDMERLSRAFLAGNGSEMRFQIADVKDGALVAVPGAIFAAALAVQAGAAPEEVTPYLREHLASYYSKIGRSAPWAGDTDLRRAFEPLISLSTPDPEVIKAVIERLSATLPAPEPPAPEPPPAPPAPPAIDPAKRADQLLAMLEVEKESMTYR